MVKAIRLEELEIYQLAMKIGDEVWEIVSKWDAFSKRTVGGQFITAVDSIAANIAEGYGRYFYKERKQFCYYSRGSLLEAKTWLIKAASRGFVREKEMGELIEKLQTLHLKLNIYIKTIKQNT
jgi:four helix bundle protein